MSELWFRADWLLESLSGYENISSPMVKKWAKKSHFFWTDENSNRLQTNPVDTKYRNQILNIALKKLESLGHIDVFWSDKIIPKPICWSSECIISNESNQWTLVGSRCEDLINYLKSSSFLIHEKHLKSSDFKNRTIRKINDEYNLNLHIKLPNKIFYQGKNPPLLPDINSSIIGSEKYPSSWQILQSIPEDFLTNIHQRITDDSDIIKISIKELERKKWLDPSDNCFNFGPPPDTFNSNKVCLINQFNETRFATDFLAVVKTESSGNKGFVQYKQLKISRDEASWLSYHLLFKNMRTLEFNKSNNQIRHPSSLELPLIISRALIFCSGLPPKSEFVDRKTYTCYTQVSGIIALRVAELLNVELIINED